MGKRLRCVDPTKCIGCEKLVAEEGRPTPDRAGGERERERGPDIDNTEPTTE